MCLTRSFSYSCPYTLLRDHQLCFTLLLLYCRCLWDMTQMDMTYLVQSGLVSYNVKETIETLN